MSHLGLQGVVRLATDLHHCTAAVGVPAPAAAVAAVSLAMHLPAAAVLPAMVAAAAVVVTQVTSQALGAELCASNAAALWSLYPH